MYSCGHARIELRNSKCKFLFNFERRAKIILWQLSVKKAGAFWPNCFGHLRHRERSRKISTSIFLFSPLFLFFCFFLSTEVINVWWWRDRRLKVWLTEWWSKQFKRIKFRWNVPKEEIVLFKLTIFEENVKC